MKYSDVNTVPLRVIALSISLLLSACESSEDSNTNPSNQTKNIAAEDAASISSIKANNLAPRYGHTSTLLQDGRVLVTGGYVGTAIQSSEIYSPDTDEWIWGPQPILASRMHAETMLLGNGRVLLACGIGRSQDGKEEPALEVETYDPISNTFAVVAHLSKTRNGCTLTRLQDGTILILGGSHFDYTQKKWLAHDDGELFNPDNNLIEPLNGKMRVPRSGHTATINDSGDVFVTGGQTGYSYGSTDEIEVYRPLAKRFLRTNQMAIGRSGHFSFYNANKDLISLGGYYMNSQNPSPVYLRNSDVYHPGGYSTTVSLFPDADVELAQKLSNGNIITTSIQFPGVNAVKPSIYKLDQGTNEFYTAGSIGLGRTGYTITELNDGSILVVGGYNIADGYYGYYHEVERIYLNANSLLSDLQ